jgi:hypothetical protein
MQTPLANDSGPAVQMPLMVVAEVQDSLLIVMHDLQRLEGLLSHACDNLMDRFGEANVHLAGPAEQHGGSIVAALDSMRAAITELQFQDMASQLIVHTTRVLQGCAFRLASESMGQEEGEEATLFVEIQPERPNPVTQSEMDAGSIELF